MELNLEGRVAVVTGAGSGIGLATAKALHREGCRVVAGDIDTSAITGLDIAISMELDFREEGEAERLIGTAWGKYGQLDVLVNCVGVLHDRRGGFLSTSDANWLDSITINLLAAVRASRAAIPLMLKGGRGSIVNVSSAAAREPAVRAPDYAAAKAAMLSLTKVLSVEFGKQGIRCNAVTPGPIRTPAFLRWMQTKAGESNMSVDESVRKFMKVTRRSAFESPGEPDDVASVIVFLASDASRYVTGSDYRVDGGATQSV